MSMSHYFISWMLYISYQNINTEAIGIDNLECSFENDLCGWNTVSGTWNFTKFSYTNPNTGPQENGGKDGSYYIYVPPMSTSNTNETAQLESPSISGDTSGTKTCFRFWYYMFGSHVRNLTITSRNTLKFSIFGDQGKKWICGIFDVTGISGKIIFNVNRTNESRPYSVIAIDHINIIHSLQNSACSQENCENIEPGSTTRTSLSSSTSTTVKTTTPSIVGPGGRGVIDLLPIVIGVPCGLLIVGAIIVGICIYKRRHSTKDIVRHTTSTNASNPYTSSPRQSGDYVDEEVYHELDESEMDVVDNTGYIEPVAYDEIKDVTLKGNGTAEYINQSETKPQDEDDYLTPSCGRLPPGLARNSNSDYLNAGNVRNGQPHNSDYLDLDANNIR